MRLCAERSLDRLLPSDARRRARCCDRASRLPFLLDQPDRSSPWQPSALGILGSSFPPGQRKTTAFALFSAGAPMGGSLGAVLGGVCAQFRSSSASKTCTLTRDACSLTEYAAITWRAVFFVSTGIGALIGVAALFLVPADHPKDKSLTVDWIGGALITSAVTLLTFALADGEGSPNGVSPSHAFENPKEPTCSARSGAHRTSPRSSPSRSSSSPSSGSTNDTSSSARPIRLSCARRSGLRAGSRSCSSLERSGGVVCELGESRLAESATR